MGLIFSKSGQTNRINGVRPGGWAEKNTNLIEYPGWHVMRVNATPVSTSKEIVKCMKRLNAGDTLIFGIEKKVRAVLL